jgi:hypothetical protein
MVICRSAQACATGAAYAVNIVIGVVRHVEIENMADRLEYRDRAQRHRKRPAP